MSKLFQFHNKIKLAIVLLLLLSIILYNNLLKLERTFVVQIADKIILKYSDCDYKEKVKYDVHTYAFEHIFRKKDSLKNKPSYECCCYICIPPDLRTVDT